MRGLQGSACVFVYTQSISSQLISLDVQQCSSEALGDSPTQRDSVSHPDLVQDCRVGTLSFTQSFTHF